MIGLSAKWLHSARALKTPVLRPVWLRWAVALAGAIAGWALREAFNPIWGPTAFPFTFFFAPVALTAWFGGLGPALLTIASGALLADWHFIGPVHTIGNGGLVSVLTLLSFVMAALLIALPIEAMHRANARTAESDLGIKNLLESLDECFYALDQDGRFTYINAKAERYFGRDRETMLGKVALDLFPQVRGTHFEAQLKSVLAEHQSVQFEFLSDISHLWLEVRAYPAAIGAAVFFRDITERRRAEERIRTSSEYLDLAQQVGRVGFYNYDFATDKLVWTDGLAALYGLNLSEFEGTREAWAKRLNPDDWAAVNKLLTRSLARKRQEIDCEFRIFLPDGAVRWLGARGRFFYDPAGQPTRFTGVNVDITALKDAEGVVQQLNAELQKRVNQLNALFEAAPVGIWVAHDPECVNVTANRYVTDFMGAPADNNVAQTGPLAKRWQHQWLRHGQSIDPSELPMQRVVRTGQPVYGDELEWVLPTGQKMHLLCNAVPLLEDDGKLWGVLAIGVDVSEQKRLEGQLRRRVEELEVLIEKVPVGIGIALDPACQHIRGNGEFTRMLGTGLKRNLSASAPKGEAPGVQVYQNGRLLSPEELPMQRACREDIEIAYQELEVRRTDGSIIVELGGATPLHDENGAVRGCVGAFLDVTQRKQAEEQLRAARDQLVRVNEELERKVEERTARLSESVADLEQFSYSISHDMRAPLRALRSFSQILLDEHSRNLNSEGLDFLRRIASAAQRLDDLIRDVLTYSRVARADLAMTAVDLDSLVREIVRDYPNFHPDKVQIDILKPLAPVLGNSALLAQCLSNLLGNAAKFVNPGARPHIEVWTELRQNRVRVSVRDQGIGIEPDHLTRIWRIFERAQHQSQYEGTGIGLSVVKRAVERMGGEVGVESQPGQGSTFWFELTAAPTASGSEG